MKNRYRTKKEKVHDIIQKEIMSGNLAPGERLVISNLAIRFNVSEIPVREALQRLSSEGYVELIPHAGAVVSTLSEEEIREIFELRMHMEALATQLAVDHLTNFHLKELEEMIESSKQMLITTKDQFEDYAKHNREFHEYIYRNCNNSRLYKIIFELWDYSNRYPRIFQTTEALQNSIEEHTEILNALKERNAKLAADITKQHKHKAYKALLEITKSHKVQYVKE